MTKKNKTIDMTKGPILGPLIFFILPLIGGSIFQQLYNTVDFIFVGNFLDKTAPWCLSHSTGSIRLLRYLAEPFGRWVIPSLPWS